VSTCETVLILPPAMAPAGTAEGVETPYGRVAMAAGEGAVPVLLREPGVEARAIIYAAKAVGARRVLAGESVKAVSPLLEPGDLVVPADTIDQTRLRPFTFFVGKGYGFIKLNPPFCPDLMATCLAAARQVTARAFKGGVYVCTDGPRNATPAELRMFRQWGADVVGDGLLPEAYLARELELCYGAVAAVGEADLHGVLLAAAAVPHGTVACACGQTMRFMKEQGVVGEDWRTW
jgi:5'-methylthioadenosine phosphorylase